MVIEEILAAIPDPEIPVVSIVDLGIVRAVREEAGKVTVTITPTYVGCPALDMIEADIRARLGAAGYADVCVETVLSPAWTTDWLSEAAKEKLRACGIAPPQSVDAHRLNLFSRSVPCTQCASENTERVSAFGSTACKALYRCLDCREPFDYFKPH